MSDFWFKHLSSTLSHHGIAAYVWRTDSDQFQWAGDLGAILGLAVNDYPRTNADLNKMLNPQDVPERMIGLHEFLSDEKKELNLTYKIRKKNGTYIEVCETALISKDQDSGEVILNGHIKAVSKTADTAGNTDNLHYTRDALSHPGRSLLRQALQQWREANQQSGTVRKGNACVLAVGIDRLSLFNETFGAPYADDLIEKTGKRLEAIIGDQGQVFRIDGDVYGVLLKKAAHNDMAAIAGHITGHFSDAPFDTERGPIGIGVSIGGIHIIAEYLTDTASVITRAELAMQVAKKNKRGGFISYREAAGEAYKDIISLQAGDLFLKALREDRVRLAFQPVISRQSNVSFHECLIRMIDEEGTLRAAGEFVPAIEKLGLSRIIDQSVIRMAIQELAMFPNISLAVNISRLSLVQKSWLRGIVAYLKNRPSIAERLIIEVTETAMAQDMRKVQQVIKTLRDLGCRVALDDFGAGYAAFSQLKDLEIDLVKIDKSFVRNIHEKQNHVFVQTLQALASSINAETVGEGVESIAEARLIAADGVDYFQGYAFGFPTVERIWLPKGHSHRRVGVSEMWAREGGGDIEIFTAAEARY